MCDRDTVVYCEASQPDATIASLDNKIECQYCASLLGANGEGRVRNDAKNRQNEYKERIRYVNV